jgi:hypothetical protein
LQQDQERKEEKKNSQILYTNNKSGTKKLPKRKYSNKRMNKKKCISDDDIMVKQDTQQQAYLFYVCAFTKYETTTCYIERFAFFSLWFFCLLSFCNGMNELSLALMNGGQETMGEPSL